MYIHVFSKERPNTWKNSKNKSSFINKCQYRIPDIKDNEKLVFFSEVHYNLWCISLAMNLIKTMCLIWTNKIQKPALQTLKQQMIINHGFVQTRKVCTGRDKMRKLWDCEAWFHTPLPQDLNSQIPFDFNEVLVKTSTACSHGLDFPIQALWQNPASVHLSTLFLITNFYTVAGMGGTHWFPFIPFPMLKSSLYNH